MAAGLPPHYVLGNNKFSSSFGTLFATLRYHQHGMIDVRVPAQRFFRPDRFLFRQ